MLSNLLINSLSFNDHDKMKAIGTLDDITELSHGCLECDLLEVWVHLPLPKVAQQAALDIRWALAAVLCIVTEDLLTSLVST
jgi:hypothetical protein